ncbi:MAG TPA: hypothetical protein VFR90_01955 [Methylibium sp.]|uniref:tetratricopeptide repeat protein n=1 Tax=Methylibium sp. TaxID=2067992 RepID=UPI002DBB21A8|nr:hypothetical protein [Methylibium sp.]HEU4457865.1 hypothetical protein [Methylibium sp.]
MSAPANTRPARLGWAPLGAMAAFVVAVAVAGYAYKGKPALLIGGGAPAGTLDARAGAGAGGDAEAAAAVAQMSELTDRLAERMKERPDDPTGWAMLGRSQAALGRHAEAAASLAKASAMKPDDATLLVDWADALAMSQGQKLEGAPLALIEKALAIDPNQLKALSLAGAAAFVKNDYPGALKHWEKLVAVGPPQDDFVREMKGAVAQARQLAGLPPAADAAPVAAGVGSVRGRVSLSAALARQVAPGDTVFVSARAADGASRMPLAVLKKQVKDLPLDFTLDDSLAMSPAAKLSSLPPSSQVIVTARISASGQAVPQPEDLGAQSKAVELGASGVVLEIAGPIGR